MTDRAEAEIEQMRRKGDQLTDDSLASTRRMKQLVNESHTVGAETMVKLNEQAEQLNNIEDRLEDMDKDLQEAEKNLTQLERCCGLCLCCCGTTGNSFAKNNKALYKKAYGQEREQNGPIQQQPLAGDVSARGTGMAQGAFVEKITNDAREDEMDKNLGEVSNVLSTLKNMAVDMGNELERQNNQLDRINDKAESNDTRLGAAITQAKRIERK